MSNELPPDWCPDWAPLRGNGAIEINVRYVNCVSTQMTPLESELSTFDLTFIYRH